MLQLRPRPGAKAYARRVVFERPDFDVAGDEIMIEVDEHQAVNARFLSLSREEYRGFLTQVKADAAHA